MHKKLIIIGASGHGKVVADVAEQTKQYEAIAFLDDNEKLDSCIGYPIIGKCRDAEFYISDNDFFVAIGNSTIRERIQEQLRKQGATFTTLIHPKATIGKNVQIGVGSVIMAGVVINTDTVIGEGCIINTCASVDHDGKVSDYVHVSVGAHLCGAVSVGRTTWIGAGVTVNNNINICENCIVGAGAVVINDIEEEGTYIGVPARKGK